MYAIAKYQILFETPEMFIIIIWGSFNASVLCDFILGSLFLILHLHQIAKINKVLYSMTLLLNQQTVQLRCNFTLTREQFTSTPEQFTLARIKLLVVCALLPTRNSCKIIRWSLGLVFDMVTHANIWYNVIDHHNILRLALGLVSRRQNLCCIALTH